MKSVLSVIRIFIASYATFTLGAMTAWAHNVPDGFSELAERLSPAVVNISTAQTIDITEDIPAFPEGSPLERFNDFFGGGQGGQGGSVSKSLGSGFVIDPEGYIVTNNHVIEDADIIEVTFPNGTSYTATLLGRDPSTDIALLKIESKDPFPAVKFADADAGKVGEWVMAIGNPFGYSGSVAAGIISARNRNISHGSYDDFIQTDVAINKGNSGGPLFNMAGDVVGVNTAILSPTGYSVGISFSVPADLAQSVVTQLREFGETRRGRLGVSVNPLTDALAKNLKLKSSKGVIVTRVQADSPASKAGLKRNDVIIKVGTEDLTSQRRLFRIIAEAPIGQPLKFTYIRKGKTRSTNAVIERLKEKVTKEEQAKRDAETANADRVAMGISVEALTEAVRRKYRIKSEVKGVRVVMVNARSEAAGKLARGDIIEEINFEPIENPEAFERTIMDAKDAGSTITILVNQRGNYKFYALRS